MAALALAQTLFLGDERSGNKRSKLHHINLEEAKELCPSFEDRHEHVLCRQSTGRSCD